MSDPITDEAIANLIGACSLSADRGFVQCDTHDMIVIYPDQDGPVREVCQEFLAFRSLATKVRADEAAKSREVIEALAAEVIELRARLSRQASAMADLRNVLVQLGIEPIKGCACVACHTLGRRGPVTAPTCPMCAAQDLPGVCDNHARPHAICHASADRRAADFTAALAAAERRHEANVRLANYVRTLCYPGVKRKTVRLDEIRDVIDRIDQGGT